MTLVRTSIYSYPEVGRRLKSVDTGSDASGRFRRRRWVGAGLAAAAAVIVVFAVAQGGGSGGGPLNAIAKAAEITQREPGGHALVHASVTSLTSPEGITETGSMVFDDSGRVRGTFTVRGPETGREAKLLIVADATRSYASSDQFGSLPEGKRWMELDLSAAVDDSSVPAYDGPEEGLKILRSVQDVEEIGKEDIEGVPTTHYRGTLPSPEEVFGVKIHASALHVDVWIDSQNRVRRMQMLVSSAVNDEEATSSTTEMTIDYVDFGQVPKIELPSSDEVFNATSEFQSSFQAAAESH